MNTYNTMNTYNWRHRALIKIPPKSLSFWGHLDKLIFVKMRSHSIVDRAIALYFYVLVDLGSILSWAFFVFTFWFACLMIRVKKCKKVLPKAQSVISKYLKNLNLSVKWSWFRFESMLLGQIELDYREPRVLCSDVELDGMVERVLVECY